MTELDIESRLEGTTRKSDELEADEYLNLKGGYVSKPNLKILKVYFDQYKKECQKLGFIDCSFSGFVTHFAVIGYLNEKEKRRHKT